VTRVHKNLNRGCWSVRDRAGAPVRHVEAFALVGVRFKVSAAGLARVRAAGVRAVHAWAEGSPWAVADSTAGLVRVSYNPFRADTFVRCDTGAAVWAAPFVLFTSSGECWARLEG
jgi:hypothetical protein